MRQRRSGVLLHPTSLPGPGAAGTLGQEAIRWLDRLSEAGQRVWQILPLGPADTGGSPYMARSAFGGNPALISPSWLVDRGWLAAEHQADACDPRWRTVSDPDVACQQGLRCAWLAWDHVRARRPDVVQAFMQWRGEQASWLEDQALFEALRSRYQQRLWLDWPVDIRSRESSALVSARRELSEEVDRQAFAQFAFDRQWANVRRAAGERGVRILGDIPIYVSLQSADVWQHPTLFDLGPDLHPRAVAGVPPDYFSTQGQRWGNPLYRWERMAEDDHAWWCRRFSRVLEHCDEVRLDHFRGFESFWEVPATSEFAVDGQWVQGPGRALFDSLQRTLGSLPVLAEDLGTITPAVDALRRECGFPGMAILQFAFGGSPANPYLPHNLEPHQTVYTGTHDNDTTLGWYATAAAEARDHVRRYLSTDGHDISSRLLKTAWLSVCETAIAPVQDVLGLGTERRMNTPGTQSGNWTFRLSEHEWTDDTSEWVHGLTSLAGRLPDAPE